MNEKSTKQLRYVQVELLAHGKRAFIDLEAVTCILEMSHPIGATTIRIDGYCVDVNEPYDAILSKWVDYLLDRWDRVGH